MKTYLYALIALVLMPVFALAGEKPPTLVDFGPPQTLVVETQNGPVSLQVELAKTDAQHSQGMMFRKSLADDAGMLFDFKTPQPVSFWMKNTFISLDMIFIDKDGHVLSIARNARPKSTRHILSNGEALAVLEIGGGRARALGIERGDLVRQVMFGNVDNTSQDAEKTLPPDVKVPKSAPE